MITMMLMVMLMLMLMMPMMMILFFMLMYLIWFTYASPGPVVTLAVFVQMHHCLYFPEKGNWGENSSIWNHSCLLKCKTLFWFRAKYWKHCPTSFSYQRIKVAVSIKKILWTRISSRFLLANSPQSPDSFADQRVARHKKELFKSADRGSAPFDKCKHNLRSIPRKSIKVSSPSYLEVLKYNRRA